MEPAARNLLFPPKTDHANINTNPFASHEKAIAPRTLCELYNRISKILYRGQDRSVKMPNRWAFHRTASVNMGERTQKGLAAWKAGNPFEKIKGQKKLLLGRAGLLSGGVRRAGRRGFAGGGRSRRRFGRRFSFGLGGEFLAARGGFMIGGVKTRTFKNDPHGLVNFFKRLLAAFGAARQWWVGELRGVVEAHAAIFAPVGINWHLSTSRSANLPSTGHSL